mmetsp:Transcript_65831/g.183400  ORF Transcript_65831/g.183400 Transcript_65831/m.183400 type:complete len:548 (-) Transcript_65831:201-1844(-)
MSALRGSSKWAVVLRLVIFFDGFSASPAEVPTAGSPCGIYCTSGNSFLSAAAGDLSRVTIRVDRRERLRGGRKATSWAGHGRVDQLPAGAFGAFSEGESTFDEDGVDEQPAFPERGVVRDGKIYNFADFPIYDPIAVSGQPAKWFEESPSGGTEEAWQTFYPAIEDVHRNGLAQRNPPWRGGGPLGTHQQHVEYKAQDFKNDFLRPDAKEAAWFDTSVEQFDAFGRSREPLEMSGRRYLEWELRTVNQTLTCGPAGCVANATLQVFDYETEEHRHCMLNVGLHATDFDDEYSRERVEWISVNGKTVTSTCDPMASGCGDDRPFAQRPLYHCLSDYPVSPTLFSGTGVLHLAGKLSPMVDECPVDGNLLSGVASVTCFVRTIPSAPTSAPTVLKEDTAEAELGFNGSALLQCPSPGCEASAVVRLGQQPVNRTCRLTVTLKQTDFDGDLGSVEEVVFVKVDGDLVKEHLQPGRNPCKESATGGPSLSVTNGTSAAAAEVPSFVAIDGEDVTATAKDGIIAVAMRISDMVDECGSRGFLLDAVADVACV